MSAEREPHESADLDARPDSAAPPVGESADAGFAGLLRVRSGAPSNLSPRQLAALQRSAGNSAVARLLREVAPPAVDRGGSSAAGGMLVADGGPEPAPGQLTVKAFLDRVEKEVCAVAERELAATVYSAAGCPWIAHWIGYYRQRSPAEVEAAIRRYAPSSAQAQSIDEHVAAICARVEDGIRTWSETGAVPQPPADGPGIPPGVDRAPPPPPGAGAAAPGVARAPRAAEERAQLGPGRPLDSAIGARMGTALGADVSGVRIHDDERGAALARREGARATAVGEHIAFASGAYEPGTPVGDALIAHELAHTVQQSGAAEHAVAPAAAAEADADRAAVGAVASLWAGTSELARRLARNARPTLRSGLALRSCPAPNYDTAPESIWARTGDRGFMTLVPGLPEQGNGAEVTPNGSRFIFDADGDQRREMEALIKVNEPNGKQPKRSVHFELTQIASRHTNKGDIELPDMGNTLPAPVLTAVTEGLHPTEFGLTDALALRVHPDSLVGASGFGLLHSVDVGVRGEEHALSDPVSMTFPMSADGPQSVFSTAASRDDPDAKESEPMQTGDIWSLDVGIGGFGDRFRLSFHSRHGEDRVTFGLGVLSDGEPVGGRGADVALRGSLDVKILSNRGPKLSLDLNGDGREDLALYDQLTVPTKEELEQEEGRDEALIAMPAASLYRNHIILAQGPGVSSPIAYYFPVREGLIRAGAARGSAADRAAASELRAVTGLAEQRALGTYDKQEGQLMGELAYIDRMLIALRQQARTDGLISEPLFKAWEALSADFIILETLQKSPTGIPGEFQKELAAHAQAFYSQLYAGTPTKTEYPGGQTRIENVYTGDVRMPEFDGDFDKEPGREFAAHIQAGRWKEATQSYRRLVKGLDRWIAESNRKKYGDPDLTKPETMRGPLAEQLANQRVALEDMAARKPIRVSAVLHPSEPYEESGQISELPLSLYTWKEDSRWRIKDLSRPDDMPTWSLEVPPKYRGLQEPPDGLFDKLDEGPHFPKGTIHWMLPSGRAGRVQTSGPSALKAWVMAVAGGLAALGLGLVTFGVGTVAVAGGYILAGSALIGAGLAAHDLFQRLEQDNATAGAILMDVAQIVSAVTGLGALHAGRILVGARMAAAAGGVARASTAVQWANRAFVPLRAANVGADVLTLAVMSSDLEKQMKAIKDSGVGKDEQGRALMLLFTQFALTGGLTALSVKGAIPELTGGRSLAIEMVNGVEYAVPLGTSVPGAAVNKSRAGLGVDDAVDPAVAHVRKLEHLANIRKQIGGAQGDNLAEVEQLALQSAPGEQLSADAAGALRRGPARPAGTLDNLLDKVTRANNVGAAHGIETEYVIRIRAPGGDGRSPVDVVAQPRAPVDASDVSAGVIRQYLAAQTGRTQAVGDALERLRGLDPASRIEVLPDGQLRINGQIDIDTARIGDVGAGRRATAAPAAGPPDPKDLRALLRGTRELDRVGGEMARLEQELPDVAKELTALSTTGAYRLRFKHHARQASQFAGTLDLDPAGRKALDELVAKADESQLHRLYDIPNEKTPRGGREAKQLETQSVLSRWALERKPRDLEEFVAHYQYIRGEYYQRVDGVERRVKELVSAQDMTQQAARQQVGFGGPGQPQNVDEFVWQQLTDPAGLTALARKFEDVSLKIVKGRTGGVPLDAGGQPSPVPPQDPELIALVQKHGRIPMPDDATAAYHTNKHHHELPDDEQFSAARPRQGIASDFDAYMDAAWRTIKNPEGTPKVSATQDGTGRVIAFERKLRWPDGRETTARAFVEVGYDGQARLLTFIPGEAKLPRPPRAGR